MSDTRNVAPEPGARETQHDTPATDGAARADAPSMLDNAAGSMGSALLQRRIQRRVMRRGGGGVEGGAEAKVEAAAQGAGQPVSGGVADKVSAATGADLSGVRVHNDSASHSAASAVQAQAYTVGQDIHFGAGKYNPGTKDGDHLLAHELVHTVQQKSESPSQQNKLEVSEPGDSLEHEADRVADQVVSGGGSHAQVSSASSGGVQRKAESDGGKDDPFKVDQGQLTFDAEGTEGGKYHTRTAHWPGGVSGVTIGRGYDLGQHAKQSIIDDMVSAGIAKADAEKYAGAAGLKGKEAKTWLDTNKTTLTEITAEQQQALFETTYAEHMTDVKRISGNYAKTKGKESGKDQAEFEINWDSVHPAIKDLLVDLRYRGDYTPATRVYVQPLAIANDLKGLAAVMADKDKWKSVPSDRFDRRKAYMEAAVAKEAAGGGGGQQQPQDKAKTTTGAQNDSQQKPPAKPGTPIGTATLKANVNVRKTPAKTGAIITTAKAGTVFQVLANTGSWYEIQHDGGKAYVTTIADYVDYKAAAAPKQEETKPQAAATGGGGGGGWGIGDWFDAAVSSVTSAISSLVSWWDGDAEEQKQAEGEKPGTTTGGQATTGGQTNAGAQTGGQQAGEQTGGDKPVNNTPPPNGKYLFKDAFTIVDADARLRDAALKTTGKIVAQGTKVYVVKAEKTYVQIVTAPGSTEVIAEGDNVWTAFGNLGGVGADVPLGNEKTDEADKKKADELRGDMPSGRQQGKSKFKWQFSSYFQPSLEGKALQPTLMAKVQRLMDWAIENDMVTGNIIIGDGVRGPKTAHKMCVSWNIQFRWGTIITLDALKKLPGGKDADGTTWYQDGWGEAECKANAKAIRASTAIAAAGHDYGDTKRLPLPLNSRPGVSRHCTGRAVDVTIPWRAPNKDATTGSTDVWAWEDVYKQFGLHRPLHKNLQSDAKLQENWHIEETSKQLEDEEGGDGED